MLQVDVKQTASTTNSRFTCEKQIYMNSQPRAAGAPAFFWTVCTIFSLVLACKKEKTRWLEKANTWAKFEEETTWIKRNEERACCNPSSIFFGNTQELTVFAIYIYICNAFFSWQYRYAGLSWKAHCVRLDLGWTMGRWISLVFDVFVWFSRTVRRDLLFFSPSLEN